MKAIARQTAEGAFTHRIEVGDHELIVDEPREQGGADEGPTPQELLAASVASCAAIMLEMYAKRKGWAIGPVEVECDYDAPERGAPTRFTLVLRLHSDCSEEQVGKLKVIAAKCPVHRTLHGDVIFTERVERRAG